MKTRAWFNILKESCPWILLLVISDAFFIFLAWLAYPGTFPILVHIMIIFFAVNILIGMLFVWRKKSIQDKVFYEFLREPSEEHEYRLIETIGELHKEKVNYLANKLRMQSDQLADAKLRAVDYEEFIESFVHEIKTPISLTTLILENRKDEMSELVYQRLEHARINISDNVEQILFYARLRASHIDYRLEMVSINLCCEDVLLELQALIDEKKIEIISQLDDVPVVSDERSLKFILAQILVNAVKYSNDEVESYILLSTGLDTEQNRYYLKISDNGIGVLNSDLPFIFDKGFTGDNPNRSQSTGIGLYLVKKLCHELKIEIEVESEFRKNFSIQLLFPIVDNFIGSMKKCSQHSNSEKLE